MNTLKREYVGVKDPVGENMYVQYITDEVIVRCKDCEFRDTLACLANIGTIDTDFCSRGRRHD